MSEHSRYDPDLPFDAEAVVSSEEALASYLEHPVTIALNEATARAIQELPADEHIQLLEEELARATSRRDEFRAAIAAGDGRFGEPGSEGMRAAQELMLVLEREVTAIRRVLEISPE